MPGIFDNQPLKVGKNEIGSLILAGDIGGTKTNMGLFGGPLNNLQLLKVLTYPSQTAQSALTLIAQFLRDTGQKDIACACF